MSSLRTMTATLALAAGLAACSVGNGQIADVPDDSSSPLVDESPAAGEVERPNETPEPGEPPADNELGSDDGEG